MAKELTDRQKQVLFLIHQGRSVDDICERMKMKEGAIEKVRNSESGKAYLEELKVGDEGEEVEPYHRLMELAPRAIKRLKMRLDEAEAGTLPLSQEIPLLREILDRSGYPRQTAATVRHTHTHLVDGDKLERLADAGRKLISQGGVGEVLRGIDFLGLGQKLKEGAVIDIEATPAEAV